MEKQWEAMTPNEKKEDLISKWLSPAGVEYVSAEAEKEYKARVTRIVEAAQMKQPDRVPVVPMPVTNTSISPPVCRIISGPVVS